MRQGLSQPNPLGDEAQGADTDPFPATPSPFSTHGEAVYEREGVGYFDLRRSEDTRCPTSNRSSPLSIDILNSSAATSAALTSLQYLPVPVLVLSSSKTVVLANESMGRLLGIDMRVVRNDEGGVKSITDVLWGQTISRLGIEILQHGSPILISWEVRFH
jgi:hypothetical protein